MKPGNKIIRLAEVGSTNEYAKELISKGIAVEGTVVVADVQTSGKGRLERLWESPKGGLWLSLILEPEEPIAGNKLGILPLMAGCAAAGAINCALADSGGQTCRDKPDNASSASTTKTARVKWPNDVMINGRKACGILSESLTHDGRRYVIIGIGININNRVQEGYGFSPVSTSIMEEVGRATEIELVQRALLSEIDRLYTNMKTNSQRVLEEWRRLADTPGRRVCINTPSGEVTGLARDIDENGALVVETEDGKTAAVSAGDCRHLDG